MDTSTSMPEGFRRLLHEERRALIQAINARKESQVIEIFRNPRINVNSIDEKRKFYRNARKRWIDARMWLTICWNTWNSETMEID